MLAANMVGIAQLTLLRKYINAPFFFLVWSLSDLACCMSGKYFLRLKLHSYQLPRREYELHKKYFIP